MLRSDPRPRLPPVGSDPVAPPDGFRTLPGTALLVPEEQSRKRQVWPRDEGRALDRAILLLQANKVTLMLRCGEEHCPDRQMERIRTANGYTLRCGCTDRVFERKF